MAGMIYVATVSATPLTPVLQPSPLLARIFAMGQWGAYGRSSCRGGLQT